MERFHRTLADEWAYARLYRTDTERCQAFNDWLLHSDPEFAAAAGFPRPILHGLCTYGMTCKAIVDAVLGGDATQVGSYGARFGVVSPGETLKASICKDDGRFIANVVAPSRDNASVLSDVELIAA